MAGHAWPLVRPDGAPDYYGISLVNYDETMQIIQKHQAKQMWDIARNDFGASIVQINHPRSSQGWFDYVGYDPEIGLSSVNQRRWNPNFDAIEVFNSGDNDEGVLTDWFSLLDQGKAYTLTGNSDSHDPESALGNPRNVFAMPTDSPGDADEDDLILAILNHQNQVSNGPFITFLIDDNEIGSLVSKPSAATVDLEIIVQAPLWVEVNYLAVYSNNGEVVSYQSLTPTGEVVRFDDIVNLPIDQDAYFVVETGHTDARLGPVSRGERVFAITNPIWVDQDGNGNFDAPGLPVLE